MILTGLSLYRVGNHHKTVPTSLTNEDRLRALRQVWPVEIGNSFFKFSPIRRAMTKADEAAEANLRG